MKKALCFLTVAIAMQLVACSTAPTGGQLRLGYEATVTRVGRPTMKYRRGEIIDAGTEPFFIEAPGIVPIYVVPAPAEGAEPPELLPHRFEAANARPIVGKKMQNSMSELLAGLNETQILLRQRRNAEALVKVDALLERYPGVSYLMLLRASTLTVMGRRSEAREALTKVLEQFPDDESAQSLLTHLERADAGGGAKALTQ